MVKKIVSMNISRFTVKMLNSGKNTKRNRFRVNRI